MSLLSMLAQHDLIIFVGKIMELTKRTHTFWAQLAVLTLTGFVLVSPSSAADYTVTELGTLGGTTSDAFGINGKGQVVGQSRIANDAETHAFLWTNKAAEL